MLLCPFPKHLDIQFDWTGPSVPPHITFDGNLGFCAFTIWEYSLTSVLEIFTFLLGCEPWHWSHRYNCHDKASLLFSSFCLHASSLSATQNLFIPRLTEGSAGSSGWHWEGRKHATAISINKQDSDPHFTYTRHTHHTCDLLVLKACQSHRLISTSPTDTFSKTHTSFSVICKPMIARLHILNKPSPLLTQWAGCRKTVMRALTE